MALPYRFRNAFRVSRIRQWKNHRELLATAARGQVQFPPAQPRKLGTQCNQALIASRVALCIVQRLEMINIDNQKRRY